MVLAAHWSLYATGVRYGREAGGRVRLADGRYLLAARRTLVDEVREPSERAALRRFLYHLDLPDDLDLASLRVEALPDDDDPAPGVRLLPAPAEAA